MRILDDVKDNQNFELLRALGGGKTELHRACKDGRSEVALKLIKNKATIDSVDEVGIEWRHGKIMAILNR